MSEQQTTTPLTYEGILELFRINDMRFQEKMDRMAQEARQRSQELDRKMEETNKQIKQTNKDVGGLSSSVGAIVANMVKGNIIEKFEEMGYNDLDDCCEKKKFKNKKLGIKGEIDLFLENGNIAILIEVKTTLETKDVRKHIRQMEEYRQCADVRGDPRRFIGAVAGGAVEGEAEEFAHANGMYVIVQSGEAVTIVKPPDGFVARKW